MEIQSKLDSIDKDKQSVVLSKFLSLYTSPAFGALPKGEVELLVLDMLIDLKILKQDPDIYDLVSSLKINRTKARSLIYDRELRRSSSDTLDKKVIDLLKSPQIQKSGEVFILEVENPLVSDHIKSKLKMSGHITDGSFSPSLIKLKLEAISALSEQMLTPSQRSDMRQILVSKGAPDTSPKGFFMAAFRKIGQKIASDTGDEIASNTSTYLTDLFNLKVESLLSQFEEWDKNKADKSSTK